MARVDYNQLEIGTTAAADLNTILSAVATETANVDSENLQQGGLDETALQPSVVSDQAITPVSNTTIGQQTLSTTWVTAQPAAGTLMQSGSFSLASHELVRVRGSIELLTDGTNAGLPAGGRIDVRVGFQHDGGPVASITPTVGHQLATSSTAPVRIPIFAVISGATYSGTINMVELQVSDQSGSGVTVQYGRMQLQATTFAKVV